MKRSLAHFQLAAFVFASLFGTVLHFLYDWSGQNRFVAIISATNESTWEHMKILFFPFFIFAFFEKHCIDEKNNDFWCVKLKGIALGLVLIPTFFYTLNGIFGKTPNWINISIFYIVAAIVCIYENQLFKKSSCHCFSNKSSLFFLFCISFAFAVFTFSQPGIPLFSDPVTGIYGMQQKITQ